MSTAAWQEQNNRYLSASLEWLRLRLECLIPQEALVTQPETEAPLTSSAANPGDGPGWFGRWRGVNPPMREVRLLPAAQPPGLEERLKQSARDRDEAARIDPPPALLTLAERLGLSEFDRDTLLLVAASEFDPSFATLHARAQGNRGRSYPTFALALWALDDGAWDALSAYRPLRFARLMEISQPGATPLTASPLHADERVVDYLKGLNVVDHRLATLVSPAGTGASDLSSSQQAVLETLLERLRQAAANDALPVMQVIGADEGSKLAVARQACDALDRRLYKLTSQALPAQAADIDAFARMWQRESLLLPVALYIEADSIETLPVEAQAAFGRFLSRLAGMVFLSLREVPFRFDGESIVIEVPKPPPSEQYAAWKESLAGPQGEEVSGRTAKLLAGQFNLNLADINQVATEARGSEPDGSRVGEIVWDLCRKSDETEARCAGPTLGDRRRRPREFPRRRNTGSTPPAPRPNSAHALRGRCDRDKARTSAWRGRAPP